MQVVLGISQLFNISTLQKVNKVYYSNIMKNETTATMTEAIDHLLFANYKHNRNLSPDVSPERWEKSGIFPKGMVAIFERKMMDEMMADLFDEMGDRNPQWNSEGQF